VKDFFRRNGIPLLIIALLLTLITAVLSFTFGGIALPVANIANMIATPFRNSLNAFVNWSEGVYNDTFQLERMKEELETLRLENATLREQVREGETAIGERDKLRNLLGLKNKRPDFNFEDAKVTAYGSSNWSASLTIGKGSADDVEAGDCVVDEYGFLVGVVSEVGFNWSTVQVVTDAELEIGALIARTDKAAILEGDFVLMGQDRCKLTYLPEDAQLTAGDTILTSGLRSGNTVTYPSGLVIGYVEEVLRDEGGMSDYAVVAPATDLKNLELVFVIKDFEMVEKTTE